MAYFTQHILCHGGFPFTVPQAVSYFLCRREHAPFPPSVYMEKSLPGIPSTLFYGKFPPENEQKGFCGSKNSAQTAKW